LYCANCDFPAHTSAFELERAKRSDSVQEFLRDRELQRHDWRRKPLPKKVLIVATLPLFTMGVVLMQVASSLTSMALGAAIMGAAVLLLWLGS
jgi:protein-S-isoprenylcysteine O-methyltransferase Ste14